MAQAKASQMVCVVQPRMFSQQCSLFFVFIHILGGRLSTVKHAGHINKCAGIAQTFTPYSLNY